MARLRHILMLLLAVFLLACGSEHRNKEYAYVTAPEAELRDRVAAVSNVTAKVKNGERVEVLEEQKRFKLVRTASGAEGWIHSRNLAGVEVFEAFDRLKAENVATPVQGHAVIRTRLNTHATPSRDGEVLYQLLPDTKVELLKRSTAPRTQPVQGAPPPPNEDWWLVRTPDKTVGWVLGRMMDVDVPLDVAQYAEGKRIVAAFVLNTVEDEDKKVPQYLVLLTEPKDGLPFDFNQFRIFTWNRARHRYETAYRQRDEGVLPVTVGEGDFGKEGVLPAFTVRLLDENGKPADRKFKMNGVMVRRVVAPGEQPERRLPKRKKR